MKNVFSLLLTTFFFITIYSCNENFNTDESKINVTEINGAEIGTRYLNDFKLVRQDTSYYSDSVYLYNYVFFRDVDTCSVSIRIKIQESHSEAVNEAKMTVNSISLVMTNGENNGLMIGDDYWWAYQLSYFPYVTNLMFVRHNVVFDMISHKYCELEELALKIDTDILNKEPYNKIK